MRDLARDWAEEFAFEPGRRRDASISLSIILSMPAGTDAVRLHDAARAFAAETFGERFPMSSHCMMKAGTRMSI